MPIRLIIVEDSKTWDEHIHELGKAKEIKLLAHYRNGEDFLNSAGKSHADIILMDIGLPGITGIECIMQFKRKFPKSSTLFLIWTIYEDGDSSYDAFRAGAVGYILKSSTVSEIALSLQKCLKGESPMSPSITRKVTDYFHDNRPLLPKETRLSKKQKQVLALMEQKGMPYKQVADALHISINSARTHIKRAYKKLNCHSLKELEAKRRKQK